jgi:hypothetical protein
VSAGVLTVVALAKMAHFSDPVALVNRSTGIEILTENDSLAEKQKHS